MIREIERRLRRAIRTRDAFLFVVASKLEAEVEALSGAATGKARAERLERLRGLVAELGIIASPHRAVPVARRRIDLAKMLAEMFDPARCVLRGIVAETVLGGTVHGRWDAAHIESIVAELVSNALKYGKGRPVTVHLEKKGSRARIVVSNAGAWRGPSGPIERFRREEARPHVRGFGVGLWLARRLARALGGRLSFDQRAGQSRAIVSLPVDAARGDVSSFVVRLRRTRR